MLWGDEPPGGRKLVEDASSLRAKMRGSVGSSQFGGGVHEDPQFLRIEVDALRAENHVLRQAAVQATEASAHISIEVNDLQQKLLRVEAENSTLHESLREAQGLLEEAVSDTPNLHGRMDVMRNTALAATAEVTQLFEALKDAQHRNMTLEQNIRAVITETHDSPPSNDPAVQAVQEYINMLRASLATARRHVLEANAAKTPTIDAHVPHPSGRFGKGALPQNIQNITDAATLRGIIEDLMQNDEETPMKMDGDDCELIGVSQGMSLTTEERIARYRARMRQVMDDLDAERNEAAMLRDELTSARAAASPSGPVDDYSPHVQQVMRELAEYRTECARLREDKQRLLQAVKQASAQANARDRAPTGHLYSDASSDVSYYSDESGARGDSGRNFANDIAVLRDERDKLVDQLVAARAAAHSAELLKQDSQDERRDLLDRLEAAHTKISDLQHRIHLLQKGPERSDRAVSPFNEKLHLPLDHLGDLPDLEDEGLDVTPAAAQMGEEEDKRQGVDEFALDSLRHVLHQTQQLLERSDQQLLDERDKGKLLCDQLEDMRTALEKTLKEGAELQHERDTLAVERDQWAQAARDADDARRKLVEHVEMLQAGNASQRDSNSTKTPEVADLLREKAELLVQIDILKVRPCTTHWPPADTTQQGTISHAIITHN